MFRGSNPEPVSVAEESEKLAIMQTLNWTFPDPVRKKPNSGNNKIEKKRKS
jgi:hypothetical protein